MKCIECGASLETRRADHPAKDLGLPHVVLCRVVVRRCRRCGEEEVVIPRIDRLNRALAHAIIQKPGRLAAEEVRFLRKCLGWSVEDFARQAGVVRETVSRWENGHELIGRPSDHFLRVAVALWKRIEDYSQEDLRQASHERLKAPMRLRIRPSGRDWTLCPA